MALYVSFILDRYMYLSMVTSYRVLDRGVLVTLMTVFWGGSQL